MVNRHHDTDGKMAKTFEETARMMGRTHDIRFDRLMPGYQDRLQNEAVEKPASISHSFLLLLVKVCVVMALIAVALFAAASFYGSLIAKGGNTTSLAQKQYVIGDDVITLAENMIRFKSQRNSPNPVRLDLFMHWPSMEGYSDEKASMFDTLDGSSPIIFVSLEPRDMTKDMSGRVATIYEKFFSGPPIDAGNGLVRRAFSADSAYFSKDL